MTEVLSTGGSMASAVAGLAAVGALVAIVLAGLGFKRRRVPLFAFALLPMAVLAMGAIGAWSNAGEVAASLESADADSVTQLAMEGHWQALGVDWLSRWAAAFVFALSALCASVGAIAAGDDTRSTPVAGGMTVLATLVGAGGLAAYASMNGLSGDAMYLVGVVLLGGLGVSAGAFKRALDEESTRVAGMRFASVALMIIGVFYGTRALMLGTQAEIFGPGGLAYQASDLAAAIAVYADVSDPVVTMTWLALLAAAAIAYFGVFYELGDVVSRYTLLDVWATLALMVGLAGVRSVEHSRTEELAAVGTNAAAREMFGSLGGDLSAALLSIDGTVKEVHPTNGGFGDVLALRKNEDESRTWVRRWAWNGTSWDADDTPLDSVQLHARRPLLAIGTGDDASLVLQALDKTADGKALLLLRANDIKGDVPTELAHLRVTFLQLEKGKQRDLEKDLWTVAGAREYNWGPTSWYGEKQDAEPIAYAAAVASDTSATNLHVLVDEKSRVKDIVNSCLPWVMERDGDGAKLSDNGCYLWGDAVEDVRKAAAQVWPLPEPANTKMTVKKLEGNQLEEAVVVDRFLREAGAIDYCIGNLRDEGEEAEGQLRLEVGITNGGKMGDIVIHERSKVQSQAVARCVARRFNAITFEMPKASEAPADAKGAKAEPPPLPKYEVLLDLKAG